MRLNAPKKIWWMVSLILGVLGVVAHFVVIPFVTVNLFWFLAVAWLLLVLSTWLKGM